MAGLWLVLTAFLVAQVPDGKALQAEASKAFGAKEYAKAASLYEKAYEAGAERYKNAYRVARCHCQLKQLDQAFAWLQKSVDAGFTQADYLASDETMLGVTDDARFAALRKAIDARLERELAALTHPELRKELLVRMEKDQAIRMQKNPDFNAWREIDRDNTEWMKKVIDKHGLPGYAMVGRDGARAVFLLIQHADQQKDFQQKCLPLMKAAVKKEQFEGQYLAYLTDRVLTGQQKPQVYGTQLLEKDGVLQPFEIEDPDNVDKRRAEVGLGPLADYIEMVRSSAP